MADGVRLKDDDAEIEAPAVEGVHPEGYRDVINFKDSNDPGSGAGIIVEEKLVDGPNREWQVTVKGAAALHALNHIDGGIDEINFPLAKDAYPTQYGTHASRPGGIDGQLYKSTEGVLWVMEDAGLGTWAPAGTPILTGTIAGRPAFGVPYRLYWSTDEHILYRDTGVAWNKIAVMDYGDLDSRSHLLADNTGLGPDHTISGASANQCLRASSSSAAAFSTGDLDNNARVEISQNTTPFAKRRELDFNDAAELTWSLTDSGANERVSITPVLYKTVVRLGSDVASSASTSFQNITGMTFPMVSGTTYCVVARLLYTASADTIGLRVSWSGPTMTHSAYLTRTTPGGTTGGVPTPGTAIEWNNYQTAADSGTTSGASMSTTAGNLLIFEGIFRPSSTTTFQLRFAPETATASGIVIEAGSSMEVW